MAQLTVRNVSTQIVRTLKQRAAAHGRSAEAEHREILREALLEGEEDFAVGAKARRSALHCRQQRAHPRRPRPRHGGMTGYVVDSSVAVKWLVTETFSEAAASLAHHLRSRPADG